MGATKVIRDKICVECKASLMIGDSYLSPSGLERTHCCNSVVGFLDTCSKGESVAGFLCSICGDGPCVENEMREPKGIPDSLRQYTAGKYTAKEQRKNKILTVSAMDLFKDFAGFKEDTPEYRLMVALFENVPEEKLVDLLMDYLEE